MVDGNGVVEVDGLTVWVVGSTLVDCAAVGMMVGSTHWCSFTRSLGDS